MCQGDCVDGLLWVELGEGLQLPEGAGFDRELAPPPVLSNPSEFSSISWMRGGIEPGISIFSVITRSAPEREKKLSCVIKLEYIQAAHNDSFVV